MKKGQKAGPRVDLTGEKFGRLTILALHPERYRCGKQTAIRLCRCDCGAEVIVPGGALRSGTTASCGWIAGTPLSDLTTRANTSAPSTRPHAYDAAAVKYFGPLAMTNFGAKIT